MYHTFNNKHIYIYIYIYNKSPSMANWPIASMGRLARLDLTANWPIGASRLEPIDCKVTLFLYV